MNHGGFGNLILTGFMGTGKTTIGREVARRLGCAFLDMDAEIERRAGKSIPRIFAEDGEAAFRKMEAKLCEELSTRPGSHLEPVENLVIATGGGALVDPVNRQGMLNSGIVICLTCGVDEIIRRLNSSDDSDRPLLNVVDPRAEIERLLRLRLEAYAAFPWQLDTTGQSVEDVTTQVINISATLTLSVNHPQGKYSIHVGKGILAHLGSALCAAGVSKGSRVAVVSNPVVAPLYGMQAENSLRAAGYRPFSCLIPDGEEHKTLSTIAKLYEQLLAGGLDRSGLVLALGGGVTGDMAGFAAASFLRGVSFAQVPTTVLAMVDASVGGKTGIDLPQGKNLVGAFKQPVLVMIDPTVLSTLPIEEFRSGMAEVIKHGIIGAPDLFAELEMAAHLSPTLQLAPSISSSQLSRALRVKTGVVEQDPFEAGRRAILNLGHTVGHALEKLSNFQLRHGEAVSIGMVAAAQVAAKLGRADPSLPARIEQVLIDWGLPTRCPPFSVGAIWKAMAYDKKHRDGVLRWVLPLAIGDVKTVDGISPVVVESVLHNLGARSDK